MKITENCLVELSYEMYFVGDNDVIESFSERNPLEILIGAGEMPEAFEAHLIDKQAGEKLEFVLSKDQAFGEYDGNLLKNLPIDLFHNEQGKIDSKIIYDGALITLDADGKEPQDAFVVEITDKEVLVDMNHPYAGEDLLFKVQILSVRLADS